MKKRRLLSIIVSVLMVFTIVPISAGSVYAATNVKIYFDNYYTQFDEVYIQGRTVIGSDWKVYKMEDAGNGFLVATVTDKVELLSLSSTKGGYSEGNGSETDYSGSTYGRNMPADGTLMVLSNNGSVSWVDYSTYERASVNKQYTDPSYSISEQPSFNESPSNVTELTIGGTDALVTKKGTGWEYKNNYLYLGENAPFDSSISAKGDLSVIVVGSINTLSKANVTGDLTLSVMGGVLNIAQGMAASDLTLNVSSYGVMSQKSGTIQATNITINTRQNGKLNIRTNSGSAIAMKCENATINGENTNEVNMFFGGGSCCGIYATESLTVNNCVIGRRGSGGSNYTIYCDEPIVYNNASDNGSAHLIHFADPWSTLQTRSDVEHLNGMRVRRCLECGQIVDLEMDYYSHSFGDWKTIKDPTCTETGSRERECTVCHETETEGIDALGHTWNTKYTVDKAATYAAAGSKSIHCAVCDAKKPNSTVSIPKLKVATPTVSKPTAAKKGFTVKWKKVSGVNGYEVQYALNSKFTKSKKTVNITKGTTVSKKITKLKAKKKYYVRVRAYKTVSGKKYYSDWSKAKTVTTKK